MRSSTRRAGCSPTRCHRLARAALRSSCPRPGARSPASSASSASRRTLTWRSRPGPSTWPACAAAGPRSGRRGGGGDAAGGARAARPAGGPRPAGGAAGRARGGAGPAGGDHPAGGARRARAGPAAAADDGGKPGRRGARAQPAGAPLHPRRPDQAARGDPGSGADPRGDRRGARLPGGHPLAEEGRPTARPARGSRLASGRPSSSPRYSGSTPRCPRPRPVRRKGRSAS